MNQTNDAETRLLQLFMLAVYVTRQKLRATTDPAERQRWRRQLNGLMQMALEDSQENEIGPWDPCLN